MNILNIIPRVYLSELTPNLSLSNPLLDSEPKTLFLTGETHVAKYDHLLLLAGKHGLTNQITATIVVDSITKAKVLIEQNGGIIISEPAPVPSGMKMVARHRDGVSFEYIEPARV
jgi:hypothetical protein